MLNVEPTGFADALHVSFKDRKGVKDGFKVFTSVIKLCYLTEMAKIVEGADF